MMAQYYEQTMKTATHPQYDIYFQQLITEHTQQQPHKYNIRQGLVQFEPEEHALTNPITSKEIQKYTKHLPNKAPGHDNIPNAALKHAPTLLYILLAILYNACQGHVQFEPEEHALTKPITSKEIQK